jgi:hypothetical protein
MADREKKKRSRSGSSGRGKPAGREGLGDDQGTRVGSPDPDQSGTSGYPGPSTGPTDKGIEGSIMEDSSGRGDAGEGATGAGAEAAQGVHAASGGREQERAGINTTTTGQPQPGQPGWSGSEPLEGTSQPHTSGYGGEGGRPRTSSDQRELTVDRGREEGEGAEDDGRSEASGTSRR